MNDARLEFFHLRVIPSDFPEAPSEEEDMLKSATVTLTNDQIKALPTTPIEIVAAPGAGKMILPIAGFLHLNIPNADSGYVVGSVIELDFRFGGFGPHISEYIGQPSWMESSSATDQVAMISFPQVLPAAGDYGSDFTFDNVYTNVENQPLVLYDDDNDGGLDYTGGHADNTLKVTVFYVIVDL